MKIGLVAPLSYPISKTSIGGVETFIFNLSQQLIKAGVEVGIFCSGDSVVPGVMLEPICEFGLRTRDIFSLSGSRSASAEYYYNYKMMLDLIEDNQYDVLHFNSTNFLTLVMQTDGLARKAVTTLHLPEDSSLVTASRHILKDAITKHRYIAISDFQRRSLPDFDIGRRIYNGIVVDDYEYRSSNDGYIGWIGRINPVKGLDTAVALASKYGWNFKFAGYIDDKEYFKKEIEPYLGQKIEYLGELHGQAKSDYLGGCSVFVMPSRWDEPFGLTVLEAMVCGTPVVGFKKGALPEIIVEGKTGFTVENDNYKKFAWAVAEAKNLDRQACRQRVKDNFTVQKMTEQYISVYKNIQESFGE